MECSRSRLLEKSFAIVCVYVLSCMAFSHVVVWMFDVFISMYAFVYTQTLVDVDDLL